MRPSILPGSNVDRLRRIQAERTQAQHSPPSDPTLRPYHVRFHSGDPRGWCALVPPEPR